MASESDTGFAGFMRVTPADKLYVQERHRSITENTDRDIDILQYEDLHNENDFGKRLNILRCLI